ncbi:MAG: heme-copper oxidase subunit III [Dehalococcoidia bacterium]
MAAEAHAAPVHHATSTGTDNRKLLMWLFLASECLFFGSLIASFLVFKARMVLPPFPHAREIDSSLLAGLPEVIQEQCAHVVSDTLVECHGILDIPVTSASTFVLLGSSLAMVLAVYGAQHSRPGMMKAWLLITALLGLTFLGFQVYEFRTFGSEGLNLSTNQFGASFFVLTGFHGTHVGVGVVYLLSLLAASFRRNGLGPEAGFHVETAGLYWHFVDIVWIVIFTVLYLIPS